MHEVGGERCAVEAAGVQLYEGLNMGISIQEYLKASKLGPDETEFIQVSRVPT
jgi:hypothetical protein